MTRSTHTRRPLYLSEEEALALLEICLYSEAADDPVKSEAMRKVAELCREHIRNRRGLAGVRGRCSTMDSAMERLRIRPESAPVSTG